MKQQYTPLLIGLLLLGGCKKESQPAPESGFQGRWEWMQSKFTLLNNDGTVANQTVVTPATAGAQYMVVTADSMNLYYSNGRVLRQWYTTQGSITFFVNSTGTGSQWTFTEYSATHVVLRSEQWNGSYRSSYTDKEYKR